MITKAEISLIRSLYDKKGREEHGLFVVEGRKMAEEAQASGLTVVETYATQAADGPRHTKIVSPAQFERLSRMRSPQGMLAMVAIPAYPLPKPAPATDKPPVVLVLDGLQDPGNLGTIIRTAEWFGVADIVCSPDTADCYNPKVVQATMGSIFRVRVHYTPPGPFLQGYISAGTPAYGAVLDGRDIYREIVRPTGVIVMGNEGNGISPETAKYITRRISIPSFSVTGRGAESLNVAVATAVILSEFRRKTI